MFDTIFEEDMQMFKKQWGTLLLAMVCLLAFTLSSSATIKIPKKMNYQGYLTDTGGTPITGNKNLRFRLYDAAGTATNWNETHSNVIITNGIFNVVLGAGNPAPYMINETFRKPYTLQIEVDHTGSGAWETMTPRHLLSNAAFAMAARKVVYQQVLTVAHDGGDTTTVCGAIDMLLGQGSFTAPHTALAPAPANGSQWVIEVQAGQYNEQAGTFGAGAGNIAIPDWVTIRGQGWDATELINVNTIVMAGMGRAIESLMIIPYSNTNVINMAGGTYCYVRECKVEAQEPSPIIDMSNAADCDVVENYLLAMGPGSAQGIIVAGMNDCRVEDNVINLNHPAIAAAQTGSFGISDTGTPMLEGYILENTIQYVTDGVVGPASSHGIGLTAGGVAKVSFNVFHHGLPGKDIIDAGLGAPPAWAAPPAVNPHGISNQDSTGALFPAF
jgi:hypothetical protein